MKFPIAIIFLVTSHCLFAQELEGLWISSFLMNIQQSTERFEPPNKFIKLDHVELDTFYQPAFGLIDFLNDHELAFKGLGNPEKKATYESHNDTIIAQSDTLTLKFKLTNDRLTMFGPDSSWQFSHLVFERISPKSNTEVFVPNFDMKPCWVIQADTNSINHGLELCFLDSGEVIISQFHHDYSRTSIGFYNIDTFRDNLFLYLLDRSSLDEQMIRLYDWNNSFYKAQSFEFGSGGFGEEPPILTNFTIKNLEPLSKKSKRVIQKKLINSWKLNGTGVPFYPELSDYDRLENEFLDFEITKTDFEIYYGAEFINEQRKDLLTNKVAGKWMLGPTGKFLELTYDNGQMSYLSIHQLTKDSFAFNLSLKTPDSSHGYRSSTIELIRR